MTGIVALAASAGGLGAIQRVLAGLPDTFPVPVLVLVHLQADRESQLAEILDRATTLPVAQAEDGDHVRPGHVYVAPPGRHLSVADGFVRLSDEPPDHFVRPSADHLFKSVAEVYRDEALVVVLTGGGSDGAEGATAVHEAGGLVFAQDADEADHSGMPAAVIATGSVDRVLPLDGLAAALLETVEAPGTT